MLNQAKRGLQPVESKKPDHFRPHPTYSENSQKMSQRRPTEKWLVIEKLNPTISNLNFQFFGQKKMLSTVGRGGGLKWNTGKFRVFLNKEYSISWKPKEKKNVLTVYGSGYGISNNVLFNKRFHSKKYLTSL